MFENMWRTVGDLDENAFFFACDNRVAGFFRRVVELVVIELVNA